MIRNSDINVMDSSNQTHGTNGTEDNTEEGIFDDVDGDEDDPTGILAVIDRKKNSVGRKRKSSSPINKIFDIRHAIKRRRRLQEELERQQDPEQFADNEDPTLNSGGLTYSNSRPSTPSQINAIEKERYSSGDTDKNIQEKIANHNSIAPTAFSVDKSSQDDCYNQLPAENETAHTAATAVEHLHTNNNTEDNIVQSHDIYSTGKEKRINIQGESLEKKCGDQKIDKFDEKVFFSTPTFHPEVKEEAFRGIYAAIEMPLKVLESDGYEAYRQYIEGCDDENGYEDHKGLFHKIKSQNSFRNKQKQKEESIRNLLTNALVNGDPREYQRIIFEVARKRNTIVNLGTGAGKTMIALLLIREIWSAQSSLSDENRIDTQSNRSENEISNSVMDDKGNVDIDTDATGGCETKNQERSGMIADNTDRQQTLFLVPSVALAIQQSLTLRANLPKLHVETACYASASSKRSRASLGKCDVIVATHGCTMDLLMHWGDTFRMDRFNLVVIDECHYAASGNHTYRHLMEKFYHPLELQRRPRILGLTASPLLNVKENHSDEQLSMMLDNLERTLDSKMISAAGLIASREKADSASKSNVYDETKSSNNILNRVIEERSLNYHGTNMNRSIPTADNLNLLPSRYREFKQLEHLYKDLGPLVVAIYCAVLRRELSKNIFENESTRQYDCAIDHLHRIEEFCNQEIKNLPNMGRNDKILALEELIETLIEERGGTEAIGLVFVERRITAIALHCYFVWRKQQILDRTSVGAGNSWRFAKEARHDFSRSDLIFELKTSENKVYLRDGTDDQFDDSADDPFRIFQQQNKTHDKSNVGKKNIREGLPGSTGLFQTNQFMDAETVSEDETDITVEKYTKRNFMHRRDRAMIKSVALVRNPVQIFNSLSMAQKRFKESEKSELCKKWVHRESNVRDVLNKLRRGDMNLMFATSVVEEGVDVQACSFVVAFDGLTNIKGYIQMKGRARKQDAKFFVFRDPDDSQRSKLDLVVAQKMEHRIQKFIEERMRIYAPRISSFSIHKEDTKCIAAISKEHLAIENTYYKVGDATVDIQSAKSLLNRYFLSIPLDPFVRCKKESLLTYMPCFEGNRLVLPVHLPSEIRTVILPEKFAEFPRKEKQKLLSLMACVRLHCYGLLNERLLPLTRKDMQSRILQVATRKLEKIESIPLNLDCFYNDDRRHFMVYPIKQKSSILSAYGNKLNGNGQTLGLITTTQIKSIHPFQLYHTEFGKVDISIGEVMFVSCSASEFGVLQQIFLLLMNSRWSRKSRDVFYESRTRDHYNAVIPPYLVGILSQRGSLDWNLMNALVFESKRSVEERSFAAQNISPTEQLPQARICSTSYNKFLPHIVFGPAGKSCGTQVPAEMKGVDTYCEYFKKVYSLEFSKDCPLLRAHRIWSLPSGLPTKPLSRGSEIDPENISFDFVEIPEQAFIEEPLADAYIALLCLFLPQILFTFERQEKTEAFIKHCENHIPTLGSCFRKMDFSTVALAVTTKSCNPNENYDSWEWVGDAVLKLLQTDSILKSEKFKHFVRFLHEGDLSMLRSAMGTNERLKEICTHLSLEKYIMMTSLARGKWIPSPLKLIHTVGAKTEDLAVQRMKVLADVIESILGVVYLEFGYHTSMKVGNELHVTLPWDESDTSVACGESGDVENSVLIDAIKMCTGHSKPFSRPKLVSEAFTHPSAIDASVPSYQRLEWIGDAVLCLCAREWLYRNLGHDTTLGELVVSEGAIVSNETLGFVSIKFGLQNYLNHRDQSLPNRIESYCWNIREGCGLWGGDPPKPIADMVEAILGSIHVSSGFASGQEATKHLMSSVFSMFKEASSEGVSGLKSFLRIMKHPKKSLQEMTGQLLDITVCSEHDFASVYDNQENDELDSYTVKQSRPQILYKDKWRTPTHWSGRGDDSCYVAFVSILGHPLVAVADESVTVARNRASSLAREAIERHPEIENRMAKCRSKVESGMTFASRE